MIITIFMHLLVMYTLDIEVLFIAGFETVINNIAQNNNNKQKSISPIGIKKVTSAL